MDGERTPPERIRITGLQEAQLPALLDIEQAVAAMYQESGLAPAAWSSRTVADIVALTREHDVRVAEADYHVAGYLAWRDEAPGVAHLVLLAVHPDYQRFGIATRLLLDLHEGARGVGLGYLVTRIWERAPWAMAFCRRGGLRPVGEEAPEPVQQWRSSAGNPEPGQIVLWMPIAPAIGEIEDDDDAPLGDNEPTPDLGSGI